MLSVKLLKKGGGTRFAVALLRARGPGLRRLSFLSAVCLSLVLFLWLAWVRTFYGHIEARTHSSLLLGVCVAIDSIYPRQSQPLDTLSVGKCAS